MKIKNQNIKALFFLLFVYFQDVSKGPEIYKYTKNFSGGFAQFNIGPAYLDLKSTDYLKQYDVLGSNYSPSHSGYSIWADANGFFSNFILGVGHFGIVNPSISGNKGLAALRLNGGYVK